MSVTLVWGIVLALALAANLPFFVPRILVVGPSRPARGLGWRLLEVLALGALVVVGATALEARMGQRAPQGWEFYAVMVCLVLTLAFPGFVWRHLRRGSRT